MTARRTVQLRSGGEITLSIEASVRELSGRDSAFVLALIEAIDQYQTDGQLGRPPNPNPTANNPNPPGKRTKGE